MDQCLHVGEKIFKLKIIILYYNNHSFPLIQTNRDMLYCFENYTNAHCYYVNIAYKYSSKLLAVNYDLIVYHDLLLCKRSSLKRFQRIRKKTKEFKNLKGYKIALVQDEFMRTIVLNEYLKEQKVKLIFSTASEKDRKMIYKSLDKNKVRFKRFLTGYVDEIALEEIKKLNDEDINKTVDVGYRASYDNNYTLGSHGLMKGEIANQFIKYKNKNTLNIDVSTKEADTKRGIEWYRFLLKSKYTLGVESGSSLLDEDGSIELCVVKELRKNSKAIYKEVEEKCFKGLDGNINLFAIGPRHFEAIMAKTCQVLVEGEYNGILKPWRHYIPLKKDFSNIDDVFKIIIKDDLRKEITETAFEEIIKSKKFTYNNFIKDVFDSCNLKETGFDLTNQEKEIHFIQKKIEIKNMNTIKLKAIFYKKTISFIPSYFQSIISIFFKN